MGIFSFFSKEKKETLDKGLSKTKENVFTKITRAIAGKSKVDDAVLDNLEEVLITSDVGVETTLKIIDRIEKRVERDKYVTTSELTGILRDEIANLLTENKTEDGDGFTLPEDKKPDNLLMLALRKFSPKLRLAIVEQAIGTIPDLGLVIIDGIRDFLYDINSPGESTDIISKFMQWTDDRQIHIHTVLHQNKNDEHARGHIGTELNNKAETIMQIEVDKEDKTISVVEAVHIRDREFEPFAFRINEEAIPEPVESYLPKEKKTGRPTKGPFDPDKEIPKNVHRPALNAVFANGNINNYDDYIERLQEGYGLQGIKLGYNKAVKVATLLSDKQMVIKEGKDYAFNPEYHY